MRKAVYDAIIKAAMTMLNWAMNSAPSTSLETYHRINILAFFDNGILRMAAYSTAHSDRSQQTSAMNFGIKAYGAMMTPNNGPYRLWSLYSSG